MKIRRIIGLSVLAALAITSQSAVGANITSVQAHNLANTFIKQHVAAKPGSLMAPSASAIKLAHAEPSSVVQGAHDYYAFNIQGGGFIIIAGEDRATQVLGYSDKGQIDFNNLPSPLKDLLDGYKKEIEFLQTYKGNDLVVEAPTINAKSAGVEPLVKTTWGQEMPYYLQCPIYQGEYCVVGCVATAMAQVMNYWKYPTSSSSIARYYCYDIGTYVPALPATTFDYSLMLDSYCHWDWDNSQLVQDTYTEEQAQEVAKLGRYCGQAVHMGYSPEGSGAYTYYQLSAMKTFGYSNAASTSKGYSNMSQWDNTLKAELDAGRPILYSANDPNAGGHAFICDGYNSEGYFHFNLGWYGTCDGWYTTSSLRMVHREGDNLNFSSGHEIVYKLEPPTYCIINADGIDANNNLMVLGQDMATVAQNVTLRTSYSDINLVFALTDANGSRVVTSNVINVNKNSFEQNSNVNGAITLPANLTEGTYGMQLDYYTTDANALTTVNHSKGNLTVVGRVAKFNATFDISDVTTIVNYVLNGSPGISLDVTDATHLINYILNAAK